MITAEQARKNVEESKNEDTTMEDIKWAEKSIKSKSESGDRRMCVFIEKRTNKKAFIEYFRKQGFKVFSFWFERNVDIKW